MLTSTRATVVALVAAGLSPATPAAGIQRQPRPGTPTHIGYRPPANCARTYTAPMFGRAARLVYAGTRPTTRDDQEALRRYERCQRTRAGVSTSWALWGRERRLHAAREARSREAASLPYGQWAIPAPIVMCESHGENLPPNGAGASGYYQIIPSTWYAYGGQGSGAYLAAKATQDAVAARIWAGGSGASQWVCAGMTGY